MNCDVCGKRASHQCSRCKCAAYCGEDCADRDWEEGGHYLECFAHDETCLKEVAHDLELGAHMFFDLPLDAKEVAIGQDILNRGHVEEAIEWLRVNRMLHNDPATPQEAREAFEHRANAFIGPLSKGDAPEKESWWAKKKKERKAKKWNKLMMLEEQKDNTKWYQFGKRRKLRREQAKTVRKWW